MRLTAAQHLDGGLFPDHLPGQSRQKPVVVGDSFPVDAHQDISDDQPAAFSWAAGFHTDDQQTRSLLPAQRIPLCARRDNRA